MAICTGCGATVLDDALFCGECGRKIENPQEKQMEGTEQVPVDTACAEGELVRLLQENISVTGQMLSAFTKNVVLNENLEKENIDLKKQFAVCQSSLSQLKNENIGLKEKIKMLEKKLAEKRCPNCGNLITEEMCYCNQCGKKLTE